MGKLSNLKGAASQLSTRRLAKESLWAICGQVVAAVIGLVSIRVLTEMVPTSAYGKANLLVGYLALATTILAAPILNAQLRYYPDYKKLGKELPFLRVIERRLVTALIIVVGILALALPFAGPLVGAPVTPLEILALGLIAIVNGMKGIKVNRLNAERFQLSQSIWNGLEPGAVLFFSVLAIGVSATALSLLAGQVLGVAAVLVVFAAFHSNTQHATADLTLSETRDLSRRLISYGAPFAGIAILSWMSNLGDRYVLGTWLGAAEVGIYAASFGLASRPILLASGVVNQLLRPILFEAASSNDARTRYKTIVRWYLVVGATGFGASILFALLGDYLAIIFLAAPFRPQAGAIMGWVAFGYAFLTLGQAIENQLMASYKPKRIILPQMVGGVTNVALAFYLIPRHGVVGAAQANMGSFALQFIATFFMWRATRKLQNGLDC
jgi:O-antigen/teichoic acid export membrane protein